MVEARRKRERRYDESEEEYKSNGGAKGTRKADKIWGFDSPQSALRSIAMFTLVITGGYAAGRRNGN